MRGWASTDAEKYRAYWLRCCNIRQEGEVSTVEVTRRMSEERDLQPHTAIGNNSNHGMAVSSDEKERRLQRWKDKLGPRDDSETAVMTASGASAIKVRRDRPSRTNEAEPVHTQKWIVSFNTLFCNLRVLQRTTSLNVF